MCYWFIYPVIFKLLCFLNYKCLPYYCTFSFYCCILYETIIAGLFNELVLQYPCSIIAEYLEWQTLITLTSEADPANSSTSSLLVHRRETTRNITGKKPIVSSELSYALCKNHKLKLWLLWLMLFIMNAFGCMHKSRLYCAEDT